MGSCPQLWTADNFIVIIMKSVSMKICIITSIQLIYYLGVKLFYFTSLFWRMALKRNGVNIYKYDFTKLTRSYRNSKKEIVNENCFEQCRFDVVNVGDRRR